MKLNIMELASMSYIARRHIILTDVYEYYDVNSVNHILDNTIVLLPSRIFFDIKLESIMEVEKVINKATE